MTQLSEQNPDLALRHEVVLPQRLHPGDRVRFVSPASTPSREGVARGIELLTSWGLEVEVGEHVYDELGYLAGTDESRLSDLNDALRDPDVKAVFATRGGKGAYRIAGGLDFDAVSRNPKLLIGFSEITILQLALWKRCRLASLHGPMVNWNDDYVGPVFAEALRSALMTAEKIVLEQDPSIDTTSLTTRGVASGFLMGGNQDMVAIANGWTLPSLKGAILVLEAFNLRLGHIDRQLTMLMNSGCLEGIQGVAVGHYAECGSDATTQGEWTTNDVLRDRLSKLNVPILGGLPFGHAKHIRTLPLGTQAVLDASAGTLSIAPAVQ